MANISDAFGTFTVEKVGNDLVEFLKTVQGDATQAYYLLVDDLDNLNPDSDGDVEFEFATGGRWAYSTNIEGYLMGNWMNGDVEKKAYDKFIKAFKKKNGLLSIEYKDSDCAMDWMGDGVFQMEVGEDGEIQFSDTWDEESITIPAFAEMNGETLYWALEYLYGDEVATLYGNYADELDKKGEKPAEPDVWYETIYEEEE